MKSFQPLSSKPLFLRSLPPYITNAPPRNATGLSWGEGWNVLIENSPACDKQRF